MPKSANKTAADDSAPVAPETADEAPATTAIAARDDTPIMTLKRIQFTRTAAIIPSRLSIEDWNEVTETVGQLREVSRFWQGDLLNAGEKRYGQKYAQALDAFGLDPGSLRNIVSVAAKFPPERRRVELTWTHHRAVSSLPDDQADKLLDRAIADGFSATELTAIVREIKAGTGNIDTIAPADVARPRSNGTAPAARVAPSGTYEGEVIPETRPISNDDWECASEECEAYYPVMAWHCPSCVRHWVMDLETCPACTGAAPIEDASASVQPDLIISPSDRTGPANGAAVLDAIMRLAELRQTVTIETVWADVMFPDTGAPLPYSEIEANVLAAHDYLGRLAEYMAEQGEPERVTVPETAEDEPEAAEDDEAAPDDAEDDSAASDDEDDDEDDDVAERLRQEEIDREEADAAADAAELAQLAEAGDEDTEAGEQTRTVDASPVVVDQAAVARDLTAKRQAARTLRPAATRPAAVNAVPKPGASGRRPARSGRGS